MEHTKHLWRAVLLLLLFGIVAVVVRHFLIPASFGAQGFYRYDSLAEFMAQPVVHGGVDACTSCHEELAKTAKEGKHGAVSCEVCHAPLTVHVKEGVKTAVMPSRPVPAQCAYCHQSLRARPSTMPQVDFKEHLVKQEVIGPADAIPDNACIACHDAHNPSLK